MNIGYIICETATTSKDTPPPKIISATKNDRCIAEGILQDMNTRNRNTRYYDSRDMLPEINGARLKELINAGYLRAECGHPMSKDIARQQTIDPGNTIAQFLKVWVEGNDIKAQYKGTNNELGEFFNKDLIDGCKPAWSLRALGTIESSGGYNKVKNIRIITWDHVIYPSHQRAYTEKIVSYGESKSLQESAILLEEEDQGLVIPITNKQVISYIKSESANIKSMMNTFDLLYDDMALLEDGNLQLTDKSGGIFVVNLENHIHNEIMDYCYNK